MIDEKTCFLLFLVLLLPGLQISVDHLLHNGLQLRLADLKHIRMGRVVVVGQMLNDVSERHLDGWLWNQREEAGLGRCAALQLDGRVLGIPSGTTVDDVLLCFHVILSLVHHVVALGDLLTSVVEVRLGRLGSRGSASGLLRVLRGRDDTTRRAEVLLVVVVCLHRVDGKSHLVVVEL
jgi:hypothetical protein